MPVFKSPNMRLVAVEQLHKRENLYLKIRLRFLSHFTLSLAGRCKEITGGNRPAGYSSEQSEHSRLAQADWKQLNS